MASRGRNANKIEVPIEGEAEFGRARKEAARELDRIERDAKDAAQDIEKAFDGIELSPELDTSDIRKAIDLAADLDGMVARLDIDADWSEIQQAEKVARSLRAFQGRVDLTVEGRDELKDALGLAEKMDQIRQVKVQVQGRQDLERAAEAAEDLGDALEDAGERGADGISDAIGGIDFDNFGGQAVDSLTGALSAAGPWAAAAGAIAATFGGDLADGISTQFGRNKAVMLDSLASGLPPGEVRRIGNLAGDAFTDGFGESFDELNQDAILLISNLSDLPSAIDDSALIRFGATAKQIFGIDIPEQVESVRRQVSTGLVDSVEEAYQLMAANSQVFGLQAEENLEVLNEYAPVFSQLKVSGVDALGAIGAAARDGVFENTDMAADSLKEMLIRLNALESSDALASIGLDIGSINTAISQGRLDEVLATIADRLAGVSDESERVAIATELFGTAVEGVDIDQFLQWLTEIGENAPRATASMQEMADTVEDSVGPWTRLGRQIRDASGAVLEWGGIGTGTATISDMLGLDETDGIEDALDALDNFVIHTRKSKDEAEELREAVIEMFAANPGTGIDDVVGQLERLEAAGRLSKDEVKLFRDALFDSFETAESLRFDRLKGEVNDVTDDFDSAAGAVRTLADEFRDLEGRFDASSGLRRIQEQSESLLESVGRLEGGLFTAGGQFDRTDPAARRFEQTLEDINGTLIQGAQDLANGTITLDQFRIMQGNAEAAIRQAGDAANATDAKVQDMIDTYTRVPDRINTDVTADDSQARAELNRFMTLANNSTGRVTLTADGSQARAELNRFLYLANGSSARVSVGPRANTVKRRASGGPTSGMTLVGEEGPELVDFGPGRSFVHDAASTSRMLRSGGGGGSNRVEVVLKLDMPALRQFIRQDVKNNGGVDVYFRDR